MKVSLIVAAGGVGRRFLKGRKKKKQAGKLFVSLGSRPLLAHTLDAFRGLPSVREIFLALPPGTEPWVRAHVLNGRQGPPVRLVRGGKTRAESVHNALLRTSPQNPWVLVHDGARPFPPRGVIQRLLRRPPKAEAAILGRAVVPTMKRISSRGEVLETVDRRELFEAQTPQLVKRSFLLRAYRENPRAFAATDEASLVESLGGRVKAVTHAAWNVKVTTPEDLKLAEAYYFSTREATRTGFGRDTHRLVEGRKFYLGGVRIPFEKGALGHSDGDALLHAVSDALLGAVAAGDIGEWFSDKNPRYKNIRSPLILKKVLEETKKRGWVSAHVDTVIILERPRLGPHKNKIRKNLAGLLGLNESSVSIKAKTAEGLGPEGEGRAVTCEALVTLKKL